jgi:predicted signal transduction protein with EAL and GGDEF domain
MMARRFSQIVNSPLYAAQVVKSTKELEEENRNIEASAQNMKDTPKNRKLIVRLNVTYRLNLEILDMRKQFEGKKV